eukprot:3931843-Rhodomonas_salina.4
MSLRKESKCAERLGDAMHGDDGCAREQGRSCLSKSNHAVEPSCRGLVNTTESHMLLAQCNIQPTRGLDVSDGGGLTEDLTLLVVVVQPSESDPSRACN